MTLQLILLQFSQIVKIFQIQKVNNAVSVNKQIQIASTANSKNKILKNIEKVKIKLVKIDKNSSQNISDCLIRLRNDVKLSSILFLCQIIFNDAQAFEFEPTLVIVIDIVGTSLGSNLARASPPPPRQSHQHVRILSCFP